MRVSVLACERVWVYVCTARINCALGSGHRQEGRGKRAKGTGKGSRAACIVYRLQQLVVAVAASAIASDSLILFGVKGLGCATPTAGVCGRTVAVGGCRASGCWATFLIKTLLQQLIYSLLLSRCRRRRLAFDL